MLELTVVERLLPRSLCLHLPFAVFVEEYLASLQVLDQPRQLKSWQFRSHVGGGIDVPPYFHCDVLVLCACQCLQFGL